MRRTVAIGIILFFLLGGASFAKTKASLWQVVKSEHFIIYYQEAPAGYADGIISKAEKYYFTILDKLGFMRFDRFWTWENRCRIYIYSKKKDYNEKTGQPEWSQASVNVKKRVISTFLGQKDFEETLLAHEMGHLIFREYIGYNAQLPLWLDEGVACLQEPTAQACVNSAKFFLGDSSFISLEVLSGMRAADIKSPAVFYAEAAGAVDFLLKKYGREKFVDFCRKIKDNTYWLDALKDVYGFKDLNRMNEEWAKWLAG